MADLTPDSFMAGLATEDDLTPDSFMAKAAKPAAEAPSLNPVAEGFRRVGEVLLGTEQRPTALGEMVYPVTATDPAVKRDLNAARAPWEAPPILDVSALGASKALPAGVSRGLAQGVEEFASGLTTPTNVLLMGGMGALKAAPTLARLASGGFSLDMMRGAYEQNQQFQQAVDAGDSEAAARALVGFTGSAAMSAAAAKHGFSTPKERVRVAPDTPAEAEASRAALASNEDLAIARVNPTPAVNQEIASRQAAGTWDKTLEKTPTPEEARARKKASKVTVPEEGDPDPILTYQRGNVAAELAGKEYAALTPEERTAVDDLVRQGYGMREAKLPAPVDRGTGEVPVVPGEVGGGVPGGAVERTVPEVPAADVGAAPAVEAARPRLTPQEIMARVEADNEQARQAGLREDAQRILEESTLDAATKPLPDVRLAEDGRVVEPRPQTWQEAQAARRAERVTPEPQPLLDQVAEAEPPAEFMRRLDETGREASARLKKRLTSTTSANEFLNPETVRDMAVSIAGDVARGVLKVEQVSQRLLQEFGPKAAAATRRVWEAVQAYLADFRDRRPMQPARPVSAERAATQRGSVTIGPVEPKPEPAPAAPPEQTNQAPAAAPPADAGIPVSPSYEKTKGRILEKLNVSPEVKQAVAGEMQAWEKANPERKKITHAEIEANARKLDPSILADMSRADAQRTAIADPALYHAARKAIPGLIEQARAVAEEIRNTPRDGNTLELERRRDQIERDVQQLIGVTTAVRSQAGRNLAMHRMMVDTAGFDPTYWVGRAKRALGLPGDASLPADAQKAVTDALAEGAAAEKDALRRVRGEGAKRKRAEAAGPAVPKRKRERGADGKPVKPTPPPEQPVDTATPPTPKEKAAVDADPKVQAAKRKLAKTMAKLEKTSLLDAISAIRRAGLLTSPRTAARNVLGNVTMQALEETSRIPGAALDSALAVFSGRRAYGGASTVAVARASYAAATRGLSEAAQVMRQGATDEQLAQFDMPRELNLGDGRVSQVLEKYTNGVFRFMSAQDRVFKRYAIERSLQEQMRLAGVDAPTEAMMAQAIADADFATFNNRNKVAEVYQRGRSAATPAGKFALDLFFPFVRTPANVLARVIDYSGGGLAKAGKAGIEAAVDKSLTPEQQRYISSNFGRGVVGPALIYMGYQLAAAGLATGSYQADPGKRNADEAAGRLAGAVKIGGTWQMVSPLSPGGALITIGATLHREATGPLRDEAKRPEKVVAVAGRTVLDHPFLQGAKELTDAVSDPGRMGQRAAASVAGSFIPTAVSDVASLGDSVRRDARVDGGVVDASAAAIAARTPGARNTLPPRLDVFGAPQQQSAAAVINPGIGSPAKEDTDPLAREIVRNKVAISDPPRVPGETLDEYRSRREIIGREIEKWMRREIESTDYANLDTEEDRRNALDKAESRARRLVSAKLGKRYEKADARARRAMLDELLKGGN